MSRPIEARVHLAALRHNYLEVKRRCPSAKAWAVVKANAYGHGLERVFRAFGNNVDGFAVLDLDEAVRLRRMGARQPVLMLEGFFEAAELPLFQEYSLSTVLHCREQVECLLSCTDVVLPLAIKFNTGMNRLGFVEADLPWLLERLPRLNHAGLTFMTHFADADGESGIEWQLARFRAMTSVLRGFQFSTSVCNSAAILRFPQEAGDWVRPGIMLYGGSPLPDACAGSLGLEPAMTFSSEIISVQELDTGATVGYGRSFRAERPMRIGIVACGYADGYPRHAPTGTPILVDGVRTQTVGRVSMDMLTVDLSSVPQATVGSKVVLWGQGLSADEVAAAAGTISYELFCAISSRVPVIED